MSRCGTLLFILFDNLINKVGTISTHHFKHHPTIHSILPAAENFEKTREKTFGILAAFAGARFARPPCQLKRNSVTGNGSLIPAQPPSEARRLLISSAGKAASKPPFSPPSLSPIISTADRRLFRRRQAACGAGEEVEEKPQVSPRRRWAKYNIYRRDRRAECAGGGMPTLPPTAHLPDVLRRQQ